MLAYEELKGSNGREVWFRPTRYDARKLFPNHPPKVRVKSASYQLHDISLTGIAVVAKQAVEEELSLGETVPLVFQQAGLSIFEGRAKVCRTESTVFGSKLAFSLVDSYVDFDRLLSRNVQAQIAANGSFLSSERSALVPREYRAFCADVLGVLRSYRALLDKNIHLADSFAHAFDEVGAFEACEGRLIEQWRGFWLTGNDIVRGIMNSREEREATKEFTELVLTPEMRAGAIWDRSYAKPLGYPGDFQIMNQVYDWEKLGPSWCIGWAWKSPNASTPACRWCAARSPRRCAITDRTVRRASSAWAAARPGRSRPSWKARMPAPARWNSPWWTRKPRRWVMLMTAAIRRCSSWREPRTCNASTFPSPTSCAPMAACTRCRRRI
jgi:hypothetical protein